MHLQVHGCGSGGLLWWWWDGFIVGGDWSEFGLDFVGVWVKFGGFVGVVVGLWGCFSGGKDF